MSGELQYLPWGEVGGCVAEHARMQATLKISPSNKQSPMGSGPPAAWENRWPAASRFYLCHKLHLASSHSVWRWSMVMCYDSRLGLGKVQNGKKNDKWKINEWKNGQWIYSSCMVIYLIVGAFPVLIYLCWHGVGFAQRGLGPRGDW